MAAPLTIIFFHLPGKEDIISQGLHGMMGELGWHCVVRGYGFGSCGGVHVAFSLLGCEISCNIGDIGVAAEF
eukprot:1755284-Ditylum_brightwellii.AAC.1